MAQYDAQGNLIGSYDAAGNYTGPNTGPQAAGGFFGGIADFLGSSDVN